MSESEETRDDLRSAMVEVLRRLLGTEGSLPSEEEEAELLEEWVRLCPHPGGMNIIYWPNLVGLCSDAELGTFVMTPEEMADFAMDWEPRTVAMQITQRIGGSSVGCYQYRLEAPETPTTHVATGLDVQHEIGDVVQVALKGVLVNGTRVLESFEHGAYSCGRILGYSDAELGTRLD